MSATQVSFLTFALAQQAANDCTPPAESSPLPSVEAGLVAQSSVSGGECSFPWHAYQSAASLLRRAVAGDQRLSPRLRSLCAAHVIGWCV